VLKVFAFFFCLLKCCLVVYFLLSIKSYYLLFETNTPQLHFFITFVYPVLLSKGLFVKVMTMLMVDTQQNKVHLFLIFVLFFVLTFPRAIATMDFLLRCL
jgi:hypothetical protein